MKSFFSILLAISLLISGNILLTSCSSGEEYVSSQDDNEKSDKSSDDVEKNDENDEIADNKNDGLANGDNIDSSNENKFEIEETVTKEKFSGELEFVTDFSDGIAIANTSENPTTICINKDGEIVFELAQKIDNRTLNFYFPDSFENGLIKFFDGSICDNKGNITKPSDLGYEEFYDLAFIDGYIIAKEVIATYDSTTTKHYILNSNFEVLFETTLDISHFDYYSDKYLFMKLNNVPYDESVKYWNLGTGEISSTFPTNLSPTTWEEGSTLSDYETNSRSYSFVDKKYEKVWELITPADCEFGTFVDGKVPVVYYNKEARKSFINHVDDDGTFLYEPVEIENENSLNYHYLPVGQDNNHVLLKRDYYGAPYLLAYNTSGELTGTINIADYTQRTLSWLISLSDGVIKVTGYPNSGSQDYVTYLFDINGNKLF